MEEVEVQFGQVHDTLAAQEAVAMTLPDVIVEVAVSRASLLFEWGALEVVEGGV